MDKWRYYGAEARLAIGVSQEEIAKALGECRECVGKQIEAAPWGKPVSIEYKTHVYPLPNFRVDSRRVAVSALALYRYFPEEIPQDSSEIS